MWVYLGRVIREKAAASAKALRHTCWNQSVEGRGAGDETTEDLGVRVGRSGTAFDFL